MPTEDEKIIDFETDDAAVRRFIQQLLRDNPTIWADPLSYIEKAGEKWEHWLGDGYDLYSPMPLWKYLREKIALNPTNIKHAVAAMEAHFKFGKQKMKLRQELQNNPLRDLPSERLVQYFLVKDYEINNGMLTEDVDRFFEMMKLAWESDPNGWWRKMLEI